MPSKRAFTRPLVWALLALSPAVFAGGPLTAPSPARLAKTKLACSLLYRGLVTVSGGLSSRLEGPAGIFLDFRGSQGFSGRALALAKNMLAPLVRLVLPGLTTLPAIHPLLRTPVQRVFDRQWRDPSYQPTASEQAMLQGVRAWVGLGGTRLGGWLGKKTAWEIFSERGAYLRAHPKWFLFRGAAGRAIDLGLKALWVAAINHSLQQYYGGGPGGGAVDDDRYAKDGKYRPKEDEVQLLIESVPFPHLAVRIGDVVYSYGVQYMQVTTASEYILAKDLQAILARTRQGDGKTEPASSVRDLFVKHLSGLPRTIQVVTLRVGKQRRREIQQYLDRQEGKWYENQTLVNDCSTMAMRALHKQLCLIDPSPSGVGMLFSLLKTGRSEEVTDIFLVKERGSRNDAGLFARNTLINFHDGFVNASNLAWNQPRRWWMDATFSEQDLQHHDETARAALATLRGRVKAELEGTAASEAGGGAEPSEAAQTIKMYRNFAVLLDRQKDPAARARVAQRLGNRMDADFEKLKEDSRQRMHNDDSTVVSRWKARYRLELLEEEQASLEARIRGRTP